MEDEIRSKMRRTVEAVSVEGERIEKRHQVIENKLRGSEALIRGEITRVRYKIGQAVKDYQKEHMAEIQEMKRTNDILGEHNRNLMGASEVVLEKLERAVEQAEKGNREGSGVSTH